MKATQRARLHLASRMEQFKDDFEWLEDLMYKQPETNERYPFGLNKQIIIAEKLYGISKETCSMMTQMLIKMKDNREARARLINKLK